MDWFLETFILLWAVIDPIGTIPVFISYRWNVCRRET